MPKIIINNQTLDVEEGLTIIQACEQSGVEIPRFCYHEKLSIAGNCRMCLVEVEKAPKLVASCAMPVSEGMVIKTDSPKVTKAREGVLEFLLINHPLDCPICDEGGECDLQDQVMVYGKGASRFSENKRAVKDKYMGPLIKTNMTRCIHCTRCVRFATELAGVEDLGTIGRGEHMEVTTYLEKILDSNISGNVIHLCPVGALTSGPEAFRARSWEYKKIESVDVSDAVCSNIRIDTRGTEVMRILPKVNEDINIEWLSDKSRFFYDGLKNQRLDRPYLRKQGKLTEVTWEEAFKTLGHKLKNTDASEMAFIAGILSDCESLFSLKLLAEGLQCKNIDFNQFNYNFDTSSRGNYLFNTTIAGIEKADLCLLIGANPKEVAPILNLRIKVSCNSNLKVFRIGSEDEQTYPITELGNDLAVLNAILAEEHEISNLFKKAQYPIIIIGDAVLTRDDSLAIQNVVFEICQKYEIIREDWNGYNILHNHIASVGALDIGFYPKKGGKGVKEIVKSASAEEIKLLYLLGADDIDTKMLGSAFVIYQGHHGDRGANRADMILPSAAFTEKDAIYINLEGRPQYTQMAVSPPGKAKIDFEIIGRLAEECGIDLGFSGLSSLRAKMIESLEVFGHINAILPDNKVNIKAKALIKKNLLRKCDINFYMTDPICRASKTMASCAQSFKKKELA